MSHLPFHNDTVSLNHIWYESQKNLLATVCIKLGHVDKIEEMTALLLGDKLKIKAMKDPARPKRAKSAYLFFCDKMRPKLMNALRKKKIKVELGALAKDLGARWKALTDEKRVPFVLESQADKERYEDAMEKYNADH